MTVQHIKKYVEGQAGYEGTRAGRRFHLGNNAAVTGIAPVQTLPTTAAQWAIKNTSSSKSMYLHQLGMFLTAGTPGVGGALLACLYTAGTAITANKTGVAIGSRSGSTQTSVALCNSGITISAPAAPIWFPIADRIADASVTAFAASATFRSMALGARILIPPGGFLGLAVVSPAGTTPLFAPFAEWEELITTNA